MAMVMVMITIFRNVRDRRHSTQITEIIIVSTTCTQKLYFEVLESTCAGVFFRLPLQCSDHSLVPTVAVHWSMAFGF